MFSLRRKTVFHGIRLKSLYVLLVLVPLIWSTNFIMGKILVRDIPPMTITAVRVSVAGVFLAALLRYNEKRFPRLEKKHFIPLIINVAAMFFLGESIYWYHILGGAMVLTGVYLGSRRSQVPKNKTDLGVF